MFHLLPPGVKASWDENTPLIQADLLAFTMLRDREIRDNQIELYKVLGARIG